MPFETKPLPLRDAARALGMTPKALRWAIERHGAPQARPGRRGRGCSAMIDLDEFAAWRAARAAESPEAALRSFADKLPGITAAITSELCRRSDGPAVRRALLASWYGHVSSLRDALHAPELETLPEEIAALASI